MKKKQQSRATVQYLLLGIVFLAAWAYQIRSMQERFPEWFTGRNGPHAWLFFLQTDPAAPRFTIHSLSPEALHAGLCRGDILLQINGVPVKGSGTFGTVMHNARMGDTIRVLAEHPNGETISTAIRLTSTNREIIGAVSIIGALIISSLCLLLGFWVAAVRPRDRLAWLLLAFLLGFATFFNPFLEGWGPVARETGAVYRAFLSDTWGMWLLLFAVNFPEPLAWGAPGARFWRWFPWVIVISTGLRTVMDIAIDAGALGNYPSVFWLRRVAVRLNPHFVFSVYGAGLGFLACLYWKWRVASSPDSRRRLGVVLAGALISFPVLLISHMIADIRHSQIEELFPPWFYNTSYLLQFFFPLAVAYTILVQRAMDVRLILRQSLQYTLARRGVIILQAVLGAILFAVMAALVRAQAMSYSHTVLLMAGFLWGIFLLNGVTHRLAALIDRHFFREAYDAEQILGDLAERVRTIVETERLLEVVTERITEALHVSRIAVLLNNGIGPYLPACIRGYGIDPPVVFPPDCATVARLRAEKEPLRVYFDDPGSWIYEPEMAEQERERLSTLGAELLLPLVAKDELMGFMALSQKRSEAPYSGSDVRVLNSVATQTSLSLEVSRLTEAVLRETSQRERLNRELEIAREVQEKLFPQQLPSIRGLDYWGECRPAREVGGDYYDFIELPEGKLGVAIGDISGKGIGAALMMANLQASLRGQVSTIPNLPALVERVNRMLFQASSANRYATFFFAEYDAQTERLAYVNAGHNPPFVLRCSNGHFEVIRLEAGGSVLGLLPEASFEEGIFELRPGDMLVLFTDGISESMNVRDEEWGESELIACAQDASTLDAHAALDRMMTGAIEFAAGAPQHDDMTLAIVKVVG